MRTTKSHTVSKVVARTVIKLTMIILATPIVLYFTHKEAMAQTITFPHPWAIIFPILLLLSFVILLFVVLRDKYNKTDANWLLALSGVMLSIYLIMLYSRISSIL